MRNWKKWSDGQAARSASAQRAAMIRWERYHAENPLNRITQVAEIMIRSSTDHMRIIRMERTVEGMRASRWTVTENGERVGRRTFGTNAIARLIARSVQ